MNDQDRILDVIRMTEEQRYSWFRALVERCEFYMVMVTLAHSFLTWLIIVNFYPTEQLVSVLHEIIETNQ